MTKILIHIARGGLQCGYVTSISDIVGDRGGIGVDIYPSSPELFERSEPIIQQHTLTVPHSVLFSHSDTF